MNNMPFGASHHFLDCFEFCTAHMDCEKPEDLNYGSVDVHGSRAIYSCDDGYKLVGGHYLVCQNGYWVGDVPQCVKKSQY